MTESLEDMLIRHEGLRLKPYKDSIGKLTIGVGRNLDDRGIRRDEAMLMLANDIKEVRALLDKYLSWWREMSEARKTVLMDMAFNMGVGPTTENPTGKLLTFKNTLKAMQEGRYDDAANGMGASLWAVQVGSRAKLLQDMMRSG